MIVIATVTVSVAVALGATGAASYAGGSLQSLSKNLVHVVAPVTAPVLPLTVVGTSSAKGSGLGLGGSKGQDSSGSSSLLGGGSGPLASGGLGIGFGDPFNFQYGLQIPTCQDGQVVFVSLGTYIYLLLHGDAPPIGIFCSRSD